jgi:hypothetical protein
MTRWSGPAVTGTEHDVNFDGRYTVAGMPGVAFWLHGWVTEMTQESWTLACDNPAHVYAPDSDSEPDRDDTHNAACYLYDEPELVPDLTRVRAVMVGDDREHVVDVTDLTEITEDDYCAGCGQTGCHADGRP